MQKDLRFEALFKQYLAIPMNDRIDFAAKCCQTIHHYASNTGLSEKNCKQFVLFYFKMYICADKEFDYHEKELYERIFRERVKDREFKKLMEGGDDPVFIEKMVRASHKMPDSALNAVIHLGLAILAVDGNISASEKSLIYRMLPEEESLLSRITPKKDEEKE